jgi:CheY-like chemotaxis protein
MRLLFVDDEPERIEILRPTLEDILDAEVVVATTVADGVAALNAAPTDLVVFDVFMPLGESPRDALGPRARRYADRIEHLGGLVFLSEFQRLPSPPKALLHTACTDFALLELMDEVVTARVPKPAPADVLLRFVLEALGLPTPQ